MSVKPILFSTEMVRGLLSDTKTVTRRAVKGYALDHLELDTDGSIIGVYNQDEGCVFPVMDCAPYRPGDILYVRETWCPQISDEYPFVYKASVETPAAWKWCPSVHMPREAARIFLRVTDVRVERLKEITETQAKNEGAEPAFEYNTPEGPVIVFDEDGYYILGFKGLWNSTIKPADRVLYGWDANPWVWVIEFERCERPKE